MVKLECCQRVGAKWTRKEGCNRESGLGSKVIGRIHTIYTRSSTRVSSSTGGCEAVSIKLPLGTDGRRANLNFAFALPNSLFLFL